MSTGLPPPDYTVNESGERVIAGSRRPDGTVRKELRVRAGYVPQDEQQVYVSRGTARRQNVPKCPGFDEAAAAAPAKPKTKSAAKNAKRKEKKLTEQAPGASTGSGGDGGGSGGSGSAAGAEAAAASLKSLSLGGGGGSGKAGAAAAAAAPPAVAAAGTAEEPPSVEKQIRNLKKKMRQAEALAEKKAGGAALTGEEEAKLSKLAPWQEELRQLEAQL